MGLFAGALVYTRYGWLKKRLMRSIAKRDGSDTDMSRDHEYTDWDAVDEFARDALGVIETAALTPDEISQPEAGTSSTQAP